MEMTEGEQAAYRDGARNAHLQLAALIRTGYTIPSPVDETEEAINDALRRVADDIAGRPEQGTMRTTASCTCAPTDELIEACLDAMGPIPEGCGAELALARAQSCIGRLLGGMGVVPIDRLLAAMEGRG